MSRILIVPESLQGEIGESFLDRRSFVVRVANDAADAIAQALEWRPALIIFGSDIAGMTAEEFTRAVGEHAELASVKLLMVTGDATSDIGHARVARPINRGKLLEAIGSLLGVQIRRSRRRKVDLAAAMAFKSDADGKPAQTTVRILRLSETGVLLESETRLKAGAVVTVSFSLPDVEQPLRSTCIVLFVDEALPQYGVEFVDMSAQDRKLIRGYVAEQ